MADSANNAADEKAPDWTDEQWYKDYMEEFKRLKWASLIGDPARQKYLERDYERCAETVDPQFQVGYHAEDKMKDGMKNGDRPKELYRQMKDIVDKVNQMIWEYSGEVKAGRGPKLREFRL